MRYLYLILCIFSIIYTQSTIAEFSFKKILNSVMPSKTIQDTIFEEYNPQKISLFTLKNKRGNIMISVDDSQKTIFLKAIKKAFKQEDLGKLTFQQKIVGPEFIIDITYDAASIDGSIDFEVIMPSQLAINVSSEEGSVIIKNTHAPARISTSKGTIEVINAYNTVDAMTQEKGSITFHKPHARIKAQTNSGNIFIHDAQGTVMADTHYGSIEMYAKEVPSTSTINLTTISGSIMLHLPPDVNADLKAYTKYGMITSDHFITLKPQTTQLNRQAWKRLQKQVDGILGTGEAQIKLSSVRSNIKLLEIKA